MQILLGLLANIGMKLLTAKVLEGVIDIGLGKLAESTKSNVDDKLHALYRETILGKK